MAQNEPEGRIRGTLSQSPGRGNCKGRRAASAASSSTVTLPPGHPGNAERYKKNAHFVSRLKFEYPYC
jgi:hypothetical protein